jgi:DNA-binding sugar fermentation-stimulating protein
MTSIYTLPPLYKALILNRPSKVCKSPYLADVRIFDESGNVLEDNIMAHSPALGCCGLISTGTYVLCTKSESTKNKSKYVINHVLQENGSVIGVNPMLANPIVKSLLINNLIPDFQNIRDIKAEITVGESRFDYTFIQENGQKVYLEVKGVPLAEVIDVSAKERKKIDVSGFDMMKKIAIFPDGYRKNKEATVSERALKHVNHLASIHKENPEIVCALLFLIQRNDVDSFKPSSLDMIYHNALYEAHKSGVKVIPVCVEWIDNKCHFFKIVRMETQVSLTTPSC